MNFKFNKSAYGSLGVFDRKHVKSELHHCNSSTLREKVEGSSIHHSWETVLLLMLSTP